LFSVAGARGVVVAKGTAVSDFEREIEIPDWVVRQDHIESLERVAENKAVPCKDCGEMPQALWSDYYGHELACCNGVVGQGKTEAEAVADWNSSQQPEDDE
jgi:hypothetical protein